MGAAPVWQGGRVTSPERETLLAGGGSAGRYRIRDRPGRDGRVKRAIAVFGLLIALAPAARRKARWTNLPWVSVAASSVCLTETRWFLLNAEMVKKGGARSCVYPDTATANGPFLEIEAEARAEARGLWDDGVWIMHDAAALPADGERFQLVEGIAAGLKGSDERFAVCDMTMKDSNLIREVQKAAAELCQLPDGTRIRARGFLRDGRFEVSHPLNVKILEAPA
jgi:hypothetical protein